VTTEELRSHYGYNHPPRAARDVRDQGIPLVTVRVKGPDGRSIAAYKFGHPDAVQAGRLGGRRVFAKGLKEKLYRNSRGKCSICLQHYDERYLQVDHRVPYEVAGEAIAKGRRAVDFMLLRGSCNRAKSWSCEHCPNWKEAKSVPICASCYWADPDSYRHVALREERRLDIVWSGLEVGTYERLKAQARARAQPFPTYVKAALRRHLNQFG